MKIITTVVNTCLGKPLKGNGINRQMKAAKRGLAINGTVAGVLAVMAGLERSQGKSQDAIYLLLGTLFSLHVLTAPLSIFKNLKPEYDKIVERAKQIYKK